MQQENPMPRFSTGALKTFHQGVPSGTRLLNQQHKAREQVLNGVSEKVKAANLVDEEGWKLVSRKHKGPRPIKAKPVLSPHQQKLKEDNRCFNCFVKGHQKSICRVKVRCIKCFKQGHFSRQCKPSSNKEVNRAVKGEVNATTVTKN